METSKALGAKPAVGPSTSASEQSSSETWRRLRKAERRTVTSGRRSETAATEARETSSPRIDEAAGTSTETANEVQTKSATTTSAAQSQDSSSTRTNDEATGTTTEARPRSAAATAPISSETTQPASASPAIGSIDEFSTERLRDYVAAFVLAGLDKNVGAETEFFADRVEYYDQGSMNRDKIREGLKRYDDRWPERHFWIAGAINVEPQNDQRVRVSFRSDSSCAMATGSHLARWTRPSCLSELGATCKSSQSANAKKSNSKIFGASEPGSTAERIIWKRLHRKIHGRIQRMFGKNFGN